MKRRQKELVGLQVTFSKVIRKYKLTNYYSWRHNNGARQTLVMKGYDLDLHMSQDDILQGLRNAYAPAILSIWQQDAKASFAELLQFDVGARPDELMLTGEWTHYAEW